MLNNTPCPRWLPGKSCNLSVCLFVFFSSPRKYFVDKETCTWLSINMVCRSRWPIFHLQAFFFYLGCAQSVRKSNPGTPAWNAPRAWGKQTTEPPWYPNAIIMKNIWEPCLMSAFSVALQRRIWFGLFSLWHEVEAEEMKCDNKKQQLSNTKLELSSDIL